ncbi:AraC family transcriptional regulator [Roseovarius sp. CAU 1744]|uniref:helix-turn-helix transcriptional regulator n=1 Tax=Roseovarius sp. CAU 1744 TaxID=3140368 RepID=UPI00325C2E7E
MADVPQRKIVVAHAELEGSGINLLDIRSSGHDIELIDNGSLTVMMPHHGFLKVRSEESEFRRPQGGTLAFRPSHRVSRVRRNGTNDFRSFLIKVPMQARAVEGLDLNFNRTGKPEIQVSDAAAVSLSRLLRYVFSVFNQGLEKAMPAHWHALTEQLVEDQLRLVLDTASDTDQKMASGSPRTISKAEAFMQERYDDPLRLIDIAAAAGVSQRQLQILFRKTTGETPWTRLSNIRLRNARERLVRAGPEDTVTSIAVGCGISHVGRFSKAYKQMFGELPSETLRRSREG